MSRFVLARSVTVPAGTAIASPVQADVSFSEYIVDVIQVIIPPGPNGLVGFQIANAGTQVIPYGSKDWIIGNNENIYWQLSDQITSGSWQVFAYNTGQYPHTLFFRFLVSPIPSGVDVVSAAPPDLSQLSSDVGATESIIATPAPPTPINAPILTNPPPAAPFIGPPPVGPFAGAAGGTP